MAKLPHSLPLSASLKVGGSFDVEVTVAFRSLNNRVLTVTIGGRCQSTVVNNPQSSFSFYVCLSLSVLHLDRDPEDRLLLVCMVSLLVTQVNVEILDGFPH